MKNPLKCYQKNPFTKIKPVNDSFSPLYDVVTIGFSFEI